MQYPSRANGNDVHIGKAVMAAGRKNKNAPQTGGDNLVHLHHLMRWTLHAFYWLDESLQNVVEAGGWQRFSHTQTMVILAIGEGITRSTDLGRILGISRQAIHQVTTELVRRKLIVVKDDPADKRAKVLSFNDEAIALRQLTYNAVGHIENELARRIGKKTFQHLIKAISADWGEPVQSIGVSNDKPKKRAKRTQQPVRLVTKPEQRNGRNAGVRRPA